MCPPRPPHSKTLTVVQPKKSRRLCLVKVKYSCMKQIFMKLRTKKKQPGTFFLWSTNVPRRNTIAFRLNGCRHIVLHLDDRERERERDLSLH